MLQIWIGLCLIGFAYADPYYQKPKTCASGETAVGKPVRFPGKVLRYNGNSVYEQGITPTCSYHSGTVPLEALVNYSEFLHASPSSSPVQPIELDVLSGMQQFGSQAIRDLEYAQTDPVTYFLKMRKSETVGGDREKKMRRVNSIYDLRSTCFEVLSGLERSSNLDGFSSELDHFSSIHRFIVKNEVKIPPFNILDNTLSESDDLELVMNELKEHFSKVDGLPISMSTCRSEAECNDHGGHAITLMGVEVQECRDSRGQVKKIYKGIFKNSHGVPDPEMSVSGEPSLTLMDLKSVLTGMKKFNRSYSILELCNPNAALGAVTCLDPPFIPGVRSRILHHLILADDVAGVRNFLAKPHLFSVNTTDKLYERTLFQLAVNRSNPEILRVLKSEGRLSEMPSLDRSIRNAAQSAEDQGKLLLEAIHTNDREKLRKILGDPKTDPNYIGQDSEAALCLAVEKGYFEAIRLLLNHERINTQKCNNAGFSALIEAVRSGNAKVVKALLEHPSNKVDPNYFADGASTPPLYAAVQGGNIQVVEALLENKEIFFSTAPWDPLQVARDNKNKKMIKLLEADPRMTQSVTLAEAKERNLARIQFSRAIKEQDLASIQTLLLREDMRSMIDLPSHRSVYRPLDRAISMGNLPMIIQLIQRGADPKEGIMPYSSLLEDHDSKTRKTIKEYLKSAQKQMKKHKGWLGILHEKILKKTLKRITPRRVVD